MYSPTTRLLAVLSLLQSHHSISGPEIARRLEVDIRTVRRYITSLQDMGVPVEGERGPHGAYYLGRGAKMPPLMFTDEEAVALALGLRAIRAFQFPVDVAAVEGALAKSERVLPEKLLQQVRGLQEAITFNTTTYGSQPPPLPNNQVVVLLSSAVQARRRVHLQYKSWNDNDSERDFDPYGIVYNEGFWYVAGYCHLRQDLRTFRLDRIQSTQMLDQTFARPEHFDSLDYVLDAVMSTPGTHQVEVLLKTSMNTAKATVPDHMGRLEAVDEGVILRRAVTHLNWFVIWLIELEFPVEIRGPDALSAMLARIAERASRLARLQSD